MKKKSSGPAYLEEKPCSEDLYDKFEPVATHSPWALRNCEQNPDKLKKLWINIVNHFTNIHPKCQISSRCKTNNNYEQSILVIVDNILKNYCLMWKLVEKKPNAWKVLLILWTCFRIKEYMFGKQAYRTRSFISLYHCM